MISYKKAKIKNKPLLNAFLLRALARLADEQGIITTEDVTKARRKVPYRFRGSSERATVLNNYYMCRYVKRIRYATYKINYKTLDRLEELGFPL